MYDGTIESEEYNKKRFKENEQPEGWITITKWNDNKKRKTGAYGKKWYNNDIQSFLLLPTDERIDLLGLSHDRLSCGCIKKNSV